MKRIPNINALMTPFPWHLGSHASVEHAQVLMQEHQIHHLPVTDEQGQVVGLVELYRLNQVDHAALLEEIMEPASLVDAHDRADRVLDQMAAAGQDVVVVLLQGRLAGIFSWRDACRGYAALLREPFMPPGGSDAA